MGECADDYEDEIDAVSDVSNFAALQDSESIIGDRSTLQFWNNVGRKYDSRLSYDLGYESGASYHFYRGDERQSSDYESSDIQLLVSEYHVYGNITENEWFDFSFDVASFQSAEDNTDPDAEIFDLQIFQVEEDYLPVTCEPQDECTDRTQVGYYSVESITIESVGEGESNIAIVFALSESSAEHYPDLVTLSLSATITSQLGLDDHPDLSYECTVTTVSYSGSVSGECDAGFTDVAHIAANDGGTIQDCYDCVVTRDGVTEEDDEGGYTLDNYSDGSSSLVSECYSDQSNSFESSGSLE
jgi:hypothetical protein